jgi:hypothetical protein
MQLVEFGWPLSALRHVPVFSYYTSNIPTLPGVKEKEDCDQSQAKEEKCLGAFFHLWSGDV